MNRPEFRTDADMKTTDIGLVPKGWAVETLADCCDKIGDGIHGTPKYSKFGDYFFVNGNNIKNGKILITEKTKKASYEEYLKYKKTLSKSTLLVSINGTIGNIARYNNEKCFLGKSVAYLNVVSKFNVRFLRYILENQKFQNYAKQVANGTTIKNLSLKDIREFCLASPPFFEQKRIAEILGALDDQIDTLTAMNSTLEAMGAAMFKSWFVDFDGVTEWEYGREGEVPKGWETGVISDIAEVIGGGTPSTKIEEYYGGSISWITPRDLSGYSGVFIRKGTRNITQLGLQKSSAKEMPMGTVLFSSRAPIGYIVIASASVTTNQGFRSCIPHNGIPSSFLFYLLKRNKRALEGKASGSTFKELSGTALKNHPILIPNSDILANFGELTEALFGKIEINEKYIQELRATRDALLPQLVGGQLVASPKVV